MPIAGMAAATTAVQAANTRIEVRANNIANMKTTGFQKFAVQTSDLSYNNIGKAGELKNSESSPSPVGAQVGRGTKVAAAYRILTQGDLQRTDQPLDIALTGPGYFAINLPGGLTGYTRRGAFQLNPDNGTIVTSEGDALDGDLTIPPGVDVNTINISNDGTVTYVDKTTNQTQTVGQIIVYTFPNERGLEAQGSDMYLPTDGSGEAIELTDQSNSMKQKFLEESNVQPVEELVGMIEDQRAYEMATRIIRTADEMAADLNKIKS
jgi:flagellar basal-body rod protein FlgG